MPETKIEPKYKDKKWLQKQVDKGLLQKAIGNKCNVCEKTIYYWKAKLNVKKKYKDKKWLKNQVEMRLTQKEIGNKCNSSASVVGDWMRKFNMKPSHGTRTTQQFISAVKELCGSKYTVLGQYHSAKEKIKMKHNQCGMVYKVKPSNFLSGKRCPRCAGNQKRTQKNFEDEVRESISNKYTVLGEYSSNHEKVLVRHDPCGCEYKVSPSSFLQGYSQCPVCFKGSELMNTEFFKKKIKKESEGKYTVIGEYKGANAKLLMCHNKCGNEWKITPNGFLNGKGRCPKCGRNITAKKLRDTQEEFENKVKELVKNEYSVLGKYNNQSTKILIRHNKCGHEWKVAPNAFLRGSRCPKCQRSKGEEIVENLLAQTNIPYKGEQKFDACRNKRKLPFDFGMKDKNGEVITLIEYDGIQHYKPVDYFGSKKRWWRGVKHDHIKDQFALSNNIPLLRVNYMDKNNGVIEEKVKKFLKDNNIL